jgi:uncharacterized protein involved in exopolysaccharide biosynthesis
MTHPPTQSQPQHASVPPEGSETISLIELVNAILRNWRMVLVLPLALALVAGVRGLLAKRSYVAQATFVSQSGGESRALSGAAALAMQFGVNLGASGGGQSPQFYEGLLKTTTILRRAVESEYEYPGVNGQRRKGTLIHQWGIDTVKSPDPEWRRAIDRLRGMVGTTVRRETGVIELRVSSGNPAEAEAIATRLLDLLNDYNLEVRQTRAREESRFISGRMSDAQSALRSAEDALEQFLRQNRDFRNSPELTFQHDRLQRAVTAQQDVYSSLLAGQEQARLDAMRDTPVLQVIDAPAGSAQPQSRKVALRTVIAFLTGLLVAIALAVLREMSRRSRATNDPHFREFEDLVRRIWSEVRRPGQWLKWRAR